MSRRSFFKPFCCYELRNSDVLEGVPVNPTGVKGVVEGGAPFRAGLIDRFLWLVSMFDSSSSWVASSISEVS